MRVVIALLAFVVGCASQWFGQDNYNNRVPNFLRMPFGNRPNLREPFDDDMTNERGFRRHGGPGFEPRRERVPGPQEDDIPLSYGPPRFQEWRAYQMRRRNTPYERNRLPQDDSVGLPKKGEKRVDQANLGPEQMKQDDDAVRERKTSEDNKGRRGPRGMSFDETDFWPLKVRPQLKKIMERPFMFRPDFIPFRPLFKKNRPERAEVKALKELWPQDSDEDNFPFGKKSKKEKDSEEISDEKPYPLPPIVHPPNTADSNKTTPDAPGKKLKNISLKAIRVVKLNRAEKKRKPTSTTSSTSTSTTTTETSTTGVEQTSDNTTEQVMVESTTNVQSTEATEIPELQDANVSVEKSPEVFEGRIIQIVHPVHADGIFGTIIY